MVPSSVVLIQATRVERPLAPEPTCLPEQFFRPFVVVRLVAARLREAGDAAAADGISDAFRDPRCLRAFIRFLRAHQAIARAERDAGDYTAWLPVYMRDDPVAEIQAEIDRAQATLSSLEAGLKAQRQSNAASRLRLRSARPMTTAEYARLSRSERQSIERSYGLEQPDELRKYESSYRDDPRYDDVGH
jgi:hypothetical protein